jgi:hypothetical protein
VPIGLQTGRLGISVHNLSVTCKWVSEKTSYRQFVNIGILPLTAIFAAEGPSHPCVPPKSWIRSNCYLIG